METFPNSPIRLSVSVLLDMLKYYRPYVPSYLYIFNVLEYCTPILSTQDWDACVIPGESSMLVRIQDQSRPFH